MAKLETGQIVPIINETFPAAGQVIRTFTLDADTFQTSLFVSSITGTLDVSVSTITEQGKEKEVITYNNITAPSTELDLKKAATAMGVVKVTATYTDACSFELRAKGLSSGETSAKVQSANAAKASQVYVSGTPVILIQAAFSDRKGVIIKNNSLNGRLYIGFSQVEASSSTGYPLSKGEGLSLDIGAGATLWAVGNGGNIDVRIIEAGS